MLRLRKDGKVIRGFRSWTDMMRFITRKYRLKNFAGFKSMKTKVGVVDLELRLAKTENGKAKPGHQKE